MIEILCLLAATGVAVYVYLIWAKKPEKLTRTTKVTSFPDHTKYGEWYPKQKSPPSKPYGPTNKSIYEKDSGSDISSVVIGATIGSMINSYSSSSESSSSNSSSDSYSSGGGNSGGGGSSSDF